MIHDRSPVNGAGDAQTGDVARAPAFHGHKPVPGTHALLQK